MRNNNNTKRKEHQPVYSHETHSQTIINTKFLLVLTLTSALGATILLHGYTIDILYLQSGGYGGFQDSSIEMAMLSETCDAMGKNLSGPGYNFRSYSSVGALNQAAESYNSKGDHVYAMAHTDPNKPGNIYSKDDHSIPASSIKGENLKDTPYRCGEGENGKKVYPKDVMDAIKRREAE